MDPYQLDYDNLTDKDIQALLDHYHAIFEKFRKTWIPFEHHFGTKYQNPDDPNIFLDFPQSWTGNTFAFLRLDKEGALHNMDDLPGLLGTDCMCWYKNRQHHRDIYPATIQMSPLKVMWYQDDKLHREDGPALIENGFKNWFLNGNLLHVEEIKIQKAKWALKKQNPEFDNFDFFNDEK